MTESSGVPQYNIMDISLSEDRISFNYYPDGQGSGTWEQYAIDTKVSDELLKIRCQSMRGEGQGGKEYLRCCWHCACLWDVARQPKKHSLRKYRPFLRCRILWKSILRISQWIGISISCPFS